MNELIKKIVFMLVLTMTCSWLETIMPRDQETAIEYLQNLQFLVQP